MTQRYATLISLCGLADRAWQWVENFRQVESSCWVEAGCSPNTQECYGGETNTHIHHSEDEEDEASEHAMEDVEEECLDDECASSLKSRCHQKTGDSSSSSGGMKREPGLSKQHPPASARRQQPGSEVRPLVSGIVTCSSPIDSDITHQSHRRPRITPMLPGDTDVKI